MTIVILILSICFAASFAYNLYTVNTDYRAWSGFFLCLNIVNASYSACKLFGG